ncbi:MAG: nuclear transport factor 2 family protein [Gemmatimonadetes bacterium]|nr:nuclear transport factor 2 family protein [Gemmatimonadota bacterium]
MKVLRGTALGTLLLLAGCKIEQTPGDYIDRPGTAEAGRSEAESEVRARVLAMGQALGRRNSADALVALAPAREVFVVVPGLANGEGRGQQQMVAALDSLAAQPGRVVTRDVVVNVGPRANVAWFHAVLAAEGDTAAVGVRITGVYELSEGAWELVQAHLSVPVTPPDPSPLNRQEPAADSAEAG